MKAGQEGKPSIKFWAKDDQPREKLLSKTAMALSNSELLAILIRCGKDDKSAIDLGKEIMSLGKDDLISVGMLNANDFMKIRGIGKVKAVTIAAALELGRRREAKTHLPKKYVRSSKDMATYLQAMLRDYSREVFGVVYLNRGLKVNHFEILSTGGITGTVADPRIILKKALEENATGLILCHNHPSGNLRPSKADEDITRKIKQAADYLDINILDHIIVSEEGYFSFADAGIL